MSGQRLPGNRLADEASPYLRAHADNPVDWQPWDESALDIARAADRPIFLSVGYAACHWCHVMAEESFEDDAVARVLNERYVPIKVDREERPDIDRIYQTICALVTRGGGWPLSVWLTPDGRPFYVGTYFPPQERGGMPGFLDLLEGLADAWEHDRDGLEERADQWMDAIKGEVEEVGAAGEPPASDAIEHAAEAAVRSADREHGGFGGSGPKFPQPARIDLLLRASSPTARDSYAAVATEALDAMATGGLFDHVGGGFHRYATDPAWTVPHFEKMLYDNATLSRVYVEAFRQTGDERYAAIAHETLAFLERELAHPEGAFYATLDARSERNGDREEGAFYVWTPAEVREVVDDELAADLFCERYGVTESGNFEGRSVLAATRGVGELADAHDLSPGAVEDSLETARQAVFEAREHRPRPARDDKIIAGWNGLAASAFAEASLALDPDYADAAVAALAFIEERLWSGGRLHRRYKDGDVAHDGQLDDYAYLARAALNCFEATGGIVHLAFGLELAEAILEEFWDADREALYYTPASGESLAARPQDLTDRSTPSSAGIAIDTLVALDGFVDHDRFGDVAERALETYSARLRSNPLEHASMCLAADRFAGGSAELTVVADTPPAEWRAAIGAAYLPNRLLAWRPSNPDRLEDWLDRLGLSGAPPVWAGRDGREEPTVYACRSFTCSRPLASIDEALAWLRTD